MYGPDDDEVKVLKGLLIIVVLFVLAIIFGLGVWAGRL